MIEMINPLLRKLAFSNLIKKSKELVLPFTEYPAENKYLGATDTDDKLSDKTNAVDLFSLFTADIIKHDVVFIR